MTRAAQYLAYGSNTHFEEWQRHRPDRRRPHETFKFVCTAWLPGTLLRGEARRPATDRHDAAGNQVVLNLYCLERRGGQSGPSGVRRM